MATESVKKEKRIRAREGKPLRTELWGLVLLTLGACFFLALVSFSRADSLTGGGGNNLIGPVGVQVADISLKSIGLCAFFLDAALIFSGLSLMFGRRLKPGSTELTGYALALPSGSVLLHL
ncbi:MAG: DNA translocase FtsK 4TM domain-containing protein, partial [Myxococcales bacterium]|nr:DNA translocase FtsK 4TM domain-containing protein [Myxococcales bacterium]